MCVTLLGIRGLRLASTATRCHLPTETSNKIAVEIRLLKNGLYKRYISAKLTKPARIFEIFARFEDLKPKYKGQKEFLLITTYGLP